MTDLKNDFYSAVARWLQARLPDETILAVTDLYDASYARGGCDTCGPDIDYTVDISYTTEEKRNQLYIYDGKFSSLLDEILAA